ncbi:unnamed protein product, partial [Tetraodon nigroviridis]
NGDEAVGGRRMLKRGGKSSYNPYSTTQRVKKPDLKDRLDILPSRHSVWLKQLSIVQEQPRRDAGDVALSSSPASSPSSVSTLTPTSGGFLDPAGCSPGTPSVQHGKLGAMQGMGCPSPVATLRRPTTLSRHASAAVSRDPRSHTPDSRSGAFNARGWRSSA